VFAVLVDLLVIVGLWRWRGTAGASAPREGMRSSDMRDGATREALRSTD
jgi:hypothetical protein